MNNDLVQNNYEGIRRERGAVWMTAHGSNEVHSVSLATYPDNGSEDDLYRQIVEGTVLAKRDDLGLHLPCAYDTAQADVTSANDVVVSDPLQFEIGQYVELPDSVATDATAFRKVTAIDYDTSTLTLDGAAFSLSEGDAIEVDAGRSIGFTTGTDTDTTIELASGDAAKFQVGDTVSIGDDTGLTVDAVDTGADTIEVDSSITFADGDQVVSDSDGGYKITNRTVTIDAYKFTPDNVMVSCRPHGRVKEELVIGLTPTAKAALQGLIIFDQRTIA